MVLRRRSLANPACEHFALPACLPLRSPSAALPLQIGTSLSRASRKKHPPKRPEGGWGLRVIPLGGKKAAAAAAPSSSGEPPVQQQQPYVAATDGSRRPLTADEALLVERQQARPRSKIN